MNEHEIRRAIVAANEAARAAWDRWEMSRSKGDMAEYRAYLAEVTSLHELYTRATGRLLTGMAA